MPAYVIVQETVRDEATFARYRAQVLPTLEAYGAKFLVRGGAFEVLEGALDAERLVILEFPGIEQVKAWYYSEAYQQILPLRLESVDSTFVVVEGLAP